jgi:DNA topoisomerase-1
LQEEEKSEEVWSRSTHPTMNNHLKQFKAKVFRTYNASKTLQDELRHRRVTAWRNLTASQKVIDRLYVLLNIAAGYPLLVFSPRSTWWSSTTAQTGRMLLCNHQRSVSKAQETQLENIYARIVEEAEEKR